MPGFRSKAKFSDMLRIIHSAEDPNADAASARVVPASNRLGARDPNAVPATQMQMQMLRPHGSQMLRPCGSRRCCGRLDSADAAAARIAQMLRPRGSRRCCGRADRADAAAARIALPPLSALLALFSAARAQRAESLACFVIRHQAVSVESLGWSRRSPTAQLQRGKRIRRNRISVFRRRTAEPRRISGWRIADSRATRRCPLGLWKGRCPGSARTVWRTCVG